MGRNVRIILAMLCLTVMVHLVIYNREATLHHLTFGRMDRFLLQNLPENVTSPNQTIQSNPEGDGQLYKSISSNRAEFLPDFPKQLVIVGYQRVGSSFFGQIFDSNPAFFYLYEPLDSVYADLYGTPGGLNVPSDVMYTAEGKPRDIPDEEQVAVRRLLTQILNCDVDSLSPGFMLHKYWQMLTDTCMPSWRPYKACLKKHNALRGRDVCWERHLQDICSPRFGLHFDKMRHCHDKLKVSEPGESTPFSRYSQCVHTAYTATKPCTDMYKQKCTKARVWVTKTVRGTMAEMDELMENNPNLRIIHLIRDPRPVVVSRARDVSFRGIYAGDIHTSLGGHPDKVREAHIYCGTAVKDIQHRQQLQDAYPGKVATVIYEDFVQNPVRYAEAVYKFMDEDIPKELFPWMHNHTLGVGLNHNATMRMNAWKSRLSYMEGENIVRECKLFYELMNYKWPYYDT